MVVDPNPNPMAGHIYLARVYLVEFDVLQSYILRADPSLSSFDESYVDAYSRTFLITNLLLDDKPGALAQMVEASYPGHNPGGQPPISAAVIDAAEDLKRAADESARAVDWVQRGGR
jgi:hypothetical protein